MVLKKGYRHRKPEYDSSSKGIITWAGRVVLLNRRRLIRTVYCMVERVLAKKTEVSVNKWSAIDSEDQT
jgi:hypothetical protein